MTGVRTVAAIVVMVGLVGACGQPSSVVLRTSPSAGSSSAGSPSASAGSSPRTTPSGSNTPPAASPTPPQLPPASRLVIEDFSKNQVRLARFDAVDIATVTGTFDEVVADQVIVVNGKSLLAVTSSGAVRTLGHLAVSIVYSGTGEVAVNPSLTQWLYTDVDLTTLTSRIHVGTPTTDSVIATIPSPNGNAFYQPFAWNASGVYMVQEATGLGGVGPFLDYHFPLATFNVTNGDLVVVSPICTAEQVLDDGTMLCRNTTGGVEVRSASGSSHVIHMTLSSSGGNSVYFHLNVSAGQQQIVVARNGNSNANLVNYQMVSASLGATSGSAYGPIDFFPDVWLPDGRVVADHLCWTFQQNSGPCTVSLNGTYFISADGKSKTLFFKLPSGVTVVGYV